MRCKLKKRSNCLKSAETQNKNSSQILSLRWTWDLQWRSRQIFCSLQLNWNHYHSSLNLSKSATKSRSSLRKEQISGCSNFCRSSKMLYKSLIGIYLCTTSPRRSFCLLVLRVDAWRWRWLTRMMKTSFLLSIPSTLMSFFLITITTFLPRLSSWSSNLWAEGRIHNQGPNLGSHSSNSKGHKSLEKYENLRFLGDGRRK